MSGIAAILRAPYDYFKDKEWNHDEENVLIRECSELEKLKNLNLEDGSKLSKNQVGNVKLELDETQSIDEEVDE